MMTCDGKKGCTNTSLRGPVRLTIWLGYVGEETRISVATIDLCGMCREEFKKSIIAEVTKMKKDAKP